jgi:hypothetical protein
MPSASLLAMLPLFMQSRESLFMNAILRLRLPFYNSSGLPHNNCQFCAATISRVFQSDKLCFGTIRLLRLAFVVKYRQASGWMDRRVN